MQLPEALPLARAWGLLKAAVVTQPRLGKARLDVQQLEQVLPELFILEHPWGRLPCTGIAARRTPLFAQEKMLLAKIQVPYADALVDVMLHEFLERPPTLIWEHNGRCGCGRRTFLFAQCDKCAKEEAAERYLQAQREAEAREDANREEVWVDPDAEPPTQPIMYQRGDKSFLTFHGLHAIARQAGAAWRPIIRLRYAGLRQA